MLEYSNKPETERLVKALRIDAIMQGLSLAKSLREEGSIDLRRFVEAIARSQTIANLKSTPGLNIEQWKRQIADITETRLRDLRVELDAVTNLLTSRGWNQISSATQLTTTIERVEKVVGPESPYLALLDADNVRIARSIIKIARRVEAAYAKTDKLQAELHKGGLSLGGGADTSAIEEKLGAAFQELRNEHNGLHRAIEAWEDGAAFHAKIANLRQELAETRPLITSFKRSVVEIETILRRYKPPRPPGMDITKEMASRFEIADVPLHALPDLRKHFQNVATTLVDIDEHLSQVFPGSARPKIKFAVSAVVRLLGFFDLMERVARTARLNQTCGDVISALRLLGSVQGKEFSAPLFDVMDPVLHAIKTHEPMNVDQLFSVISKVRLDSLITSLAATASKKPCQNNERGHECWTVKIIHSLQEAIQRDGDSIRIDGGAFAKRLASHGDDFRRKHKWRSYFHLTVGFGGLYSLSPPVATGATELEDRMVPLIGEQIGFGWASPTFYHDTFTFKFGAYGSGILYRTVLDSSESNAIMASPFIALDLYDLIELYAGPTILFYPPSEDQDAGIRFGATFGITVPLNAYLEKL